MYCWGYPTRLPDAAAVPRKCDVNWSDGGLGMTASVLAERGRSWEIVAHPLPGEYSFRAI